jgi:hypothetical protein
MFILLAVLEVTQRVPPTCITNTNFTYPLLPPLFLVFHHLRGTRGRQQGALSLDAVGLVLDQFDPEKKKGPIIIVLSVQTYLGPKVQRFKGPKVQRI